MGDTILVPDMHCGGCARGVTAALREAGIPEEGLKINLEKRDVLLTPGADVAAALAALHADGWKASLAPDAEP